MHRAAFPRTLPHGVYGRCGWVLQVHSRTRLRAIRNEGGRTPWGVILLALLLALLLGGLGFAAHILWFIAAIVFLFWLVGFALGRGHTEGARGWYRW